MSIDYRPEIYILPELNATDAAYYQSLIEILRWMVGLGRVDITTEVSMLLSCLALPRREHLKQRNGDGKLQDCKYHMPNKAPAPMSNRYRPEIDISSEFNATDDAYYQPLIGILR